jgi:hypothetical protein
MEDFLRGLSALRNNAPEVMAELLPSQEQRERLQRSGLFPPGFHPMNAGGPLVNRAVGRFGAKLALALHYRITARIVPTSGGVALRWYTNWDHATQRFPADVAANLGPPSTLQQGSKSVEGQFAYASQAATDAPMSAHLATLRYSIAIIAFVAHDVADLNVAEAEQQVWRPGFLRQSATASGIAST